MVGNFRGSFSKALAVYAFSLSFSVLCPFAAGQQYPGDEDVPGIGAGRALRHIGDKTVRVPAGTGRGG